MRPINLTMEVLLGNVGGPRYMLGFKYYPETPDTRESPGDAAECCAEGILEVIDPNGDTSYMSYEQMIKMYAEEAEISEEAAEEQINEQMHEAANKWMEDM
jgi:hypothetical protein